MDTEKRQAGASTDFDFLISVLQDALNYDVGADLLSDHPHSITSLADEIALRVVLAAKEQGRGTIRLVA